MLEHKQPFGDHLGLAVVDSPTSNGYGPPGPSLLKLAWTDLDAQVIDATWLRTSTGFPLRRQSLRGWGVEWPSVGQCSFQTRTPPKSRS